MPRSRHQAPRIEQKGFGRRLADDGCDKTGKVRIAPCGEVLDQFQSAARQREHHASCRDRGRAVRAIDEAQRECLTRQSRQGKTGQPRFCQNSRAEELRFGCERERQFLIAARDREKRFRQIGSKQLFVEFTKRGAERRDVIAPRILEKAVFLGRKYVGHQRPVRPILEQPAFVTEADRMREPTRGRHMAEAGNDFFDALHIARTVRRLVRRRNIVGKEFSRRPCFRIGVACAPQGEMVLRFLDRIASRGQPELPHKVEHMFVSRQEAHAAGLADQMRRLWKRDGAQPPADPVAQLEQRDAQMGLFAGKAPRRVAACHAAANDRDIGIGIGHRYRYSHPPAPPAARATVPRRRQAGFSA